MIIELIESSSESSSKPAGKDFSNKDSEMRNKHQRTRECMRMEQWSETERFLAIHPRKWQLFSAIVGITGHLSHGTGMSAI
jgi:hypothetical protein